MDSFRLRSPFLVPHLARIRVLRFELHGGAPQVQHWQEFLDGVAGTLRRLSLNCVSDLARVLSFAPRLRLETFRFEAISLLRVNRPTPADFLAYLKTSDSINHLYAPVGLDSAFVDSLPVSLRALSNRMAVPIGPARSAAELMATLWAGLEALITSKKSRTPFLLKVVRAGWVSSALAEATEVRDLVDKASKIGLEILLEPSAINVDQPCASLFQPSQILDGGHD